MLRNLLLSAVVFCRIHRSVARVIVAAALACATAIAAEGTPDTSRPGNYLVYFGTYTRGTSRGIYASVFDAATGLLTPPILAVETGNPAFLAIHPSHRFLYALDATSGTSNGLVRAFAIDRKSGLLTFLNQQPSAGAGPTHLAVDKTGACLLVANYASGSIAALPIHADGTLGPPTTFIQHHGSSVDPKRQQGPHAHGVGFDLADRRAFCADLGLDKVLVYRFDAATASLSPNEPPSASVAPGAGSRHFALLPDGRRLYVINEMKSTVTAFDYDEKHGALTEFQTISTLPATFTGTNTAAEVAIHPGGRFLYASNRGDNSIAVYAIAESTGKLSLIQRQLTLGKTPRMFALDPTGHFLLAANQESDSIVVFGIDQKTGHLTPTGQSVEISMPACITFAPEE
ncbi:MAG TPA: lactonase family protein [Verrucomicrobiae bacterium]|nr:lactonase family protein [Verrucomicrobiae bacterium]